MDNKTWLWKKRSTAKTLEADKSSEILRCEGEKAEGPVSENKGLGRELTLLNEKLSSALAECDAKDNIVVKQVKIAEDAIAGWEKAEKEAASLKQEIDEVLKQKAASEDRLVNTDAALRECMQELRHVCEKQDKASESEDHHMSNVALGKKSAEALRRRIVRLESENAQLAKAVSVKDKVIEDLSECRAQIEADINALILRLDATKKENDSLKYDVRVLHKELQTRNEEREVHRRTAEASEKQKVELEAECQRLRILVGKQLSDGSASQSETEHLRNEKMLGTACNRNRMLASDMNLMDDFAEMEKLAGVSVKGSDMNKSDDKVLEDVSLPINKILELLEGISIKPHGIRTMENLANDDDDNYIVRVFQWRSSELSTVLQRFIQICHDLQNGMASLEQFVQQVASDLEWVMDHCFSLQDVPSMNESFVNQLYWDESVGEDEVTVNNDSCQNKESQPVIIAEEFKTWNNELADKGYPSMEFEAMLQSEVANGECLITQLQESKSTIEKLRSEIESLKQSLGIDGFGKARLNQPMDETSHCSTVPKDRSRTDEANHNRKHLNKDWEINATSEKLAKCQATITDLGKQLKSMAPANDASVFDEILSRSEGKRSASSTGKSTSKRRSTLLDRMLAEDRARLASSFRTAISECQKGISSSELSNNGSSMVSDGKKGRTKFTAADVDVVNRTKGDDYGDRSFFKRLFRRRKNG